MTTGPTQYAMSQNQDRIEPRIHFLVGAELLPIHFGAAATGKPSVAIFCHIGLDHRT